MVDQKRGIANFHGKLGTNDPLYTKLGESGAYPKYPYMFNLYM